jgi:hypothetical protein
MVVMRFEVEFTQKLFTYQDVLVSPTIATLKDIPNGL